MCRFTLYLGPPIRLSSLLLEPAHSLIRQSTDAKERDEPLNGDGFGVGWYNPELSAEPAVFRSITPAWNNRNLHGLSRVVASPCILAHVRAASVWSGVNEANCHPFRYRRYLFMHNGEIGNFRAIRRRLLNSVCDESFGNVYGSTDSEHAFALLIDELLRAPAADPTALARALHAALWRVLDLADAGGPEPSTLNWAFTDGEAAVVCRLTNASGVKPESLYYLSGRLYAPERGRAAPNAKGGSFVVSSERLTDDPRWTEIPPQHLLLLRRGGKPRLFRSRREGLLPV